LGVMATAIIPEADRKRVTELYAEGAKIAGYDTMPQAAVDRCTHSSLPRAVHVWQAKHVCVAGFHCKQGDALQGKCWQL